MDPSDTDPDSTTTELLRRLSAAEARAEHAERLATLGRLLTGVVHEINNPLTAITMYADALAARLPDAADREKASAILQAGLRIQGLSRELVAYVRPPAAPENVYALPDLVEAGLELCRAELKATGARLERRAHDAAPARVRGMRESLIQVVVALVSNAAAAGRGHRVRVEVRTDAAEAILAVTDEGDGMAPEVLARALEPFFTTRPEPRLGLGLTCAQLIAERHGGRLTLASEVGRGTTAVVRLPRADPAAVP